MEPHLKGIRSISCPLLVCLILVTTSSSNLLNQDDKFATSNTLFSGGDDVEIMPNIESFKSPNSTADVLDFSQPDDRIISRDKVQGMDLDIFGVITGIMTIYDFIAGKLHSDGDKYQKEFDEANYKLDELNKKLDQMMAQLKVEFIKVKLANDINTISDCNFALKDYLDCLNNTLDNFICESKKNLFIMNAEGSTGNQLDNSLRHIMDSMTGSMPDNDIPRTYRLALDGYEHRLVEQLDLWMIWVNMGIYVHAAYVNTKNMTQADNRFYRNYLDTTYNVTMPKKRAEECEICRNESTVPQEINSVLHDCQNLDLQATTNRLLKFLQDKYRTKVWSVIVYRDIAGYDKHCFDARFYNSLHHWGKNALAYSHQSKDRISKVDLNFLVKHTYIDGPFGDLIHANGLWESLYAGTGGRVVLAVIEIIDADIHFGGYFDFVGKAYFVGLGDAFTVIGFSPSRNTYFSSDSNKETGDYSMGHISSSAFDDSSVSDQMSPEQIVRVPIMEFILNPEAILIVFILGLILIVCTVRFSFSKNNLRASKCKHENHDNWMNEKKIPI